MTRPVPRLAPRAKASHKGDFGRVLLIGGSVGMSGSIALTGMAALRSGAGLVRLAVPAPILATVAGHEPSYMTLALPADEQGRIAGQARDLLESRWSENPAESTVVAIGPGLGRSRELDRLVHWLYTTVPLPMVVDADALNALAESPATLARPGGPRVLTPHPGEFRRLAAKQLPALQFAGGSSAGDGDPRERALEHAMAMAADCGVVVVLKGSPTFVTDGSEHRVNEVGNPGMATGGSGDVLTGTIAALIAQHLSPLDAAYLGVHVHGRAGDLAAAELGEVGMIASDIVRQLPRAFLDFVDSTSAAE